MSIKLWENGTPGFKPEAGQEEPNLTPYIIKTDKPVGCVIVCPGGGYGHLAEHEGKPVAELMNEGGMQAFVLQYRLAPGYHHPAMQEDVNRAVRWVRYHAAEYNIDPEKIGVLGFSAGGHLAGVAVTHYDAGFDGGDEIDRVSCRPNAGILCYAVLDFNEKYAHTGTMKNMLAELSENEEMRKFYSCQLQVTEDTPPCFLWHTAADRGVPVENSLMMAAALSEKKVPFELHVFPFGGHGIGLATGYNGRPVDGHIAQWGPLCVKWLHLIGF